MLLLSWIAGASTARAAEPTGDDSVGEAAAAWKALRPRRGHFDGAAYAADIDRWQGVKHLAMQQLAAHALARRLAPPALEDLMGMPDARWHARSPDHARARADARWQMNTSSEGLRRADLWVYHWRGRHDRLVFAFVQGRVVDIGWLHALE